MNRHEMIDRVAKDYEVARKRLASSEADASTIDYVAALLVVAARLEALEDALVEGLPTAGEGV